MTEPKIYPQTPDTTGVSDPPRSTALDARGGAVVLLCWALHCASQWGRPFGALVVLAFATGSLFVALALLFAERSLLAIGAFWGVIALPRAWTDALAQGGWRSFMVVLHCAPLVIGLRAIVRGGLVPGACWRALLAASLLRQCSRWITHDSATLERLWGVEPLAQRWFSRGSQGLASFVLLALLCLALDRGLRGLHERRAARAASSR